MINKLRKSLLNGNIKISFAENCWKEDFKVVSANKSFYNNYNTYADKSVAQSFFAFNASPAMLPELKKVFADVLNQEQGASDKVVIEGFSYIFKKDQPVNLVVQKINASTILLQVLKS